MLWVVNEILMNIRATKKQKKEVSLQAPIGTDKEGNEISLPSYMYIVYSLLINSSQLLKSVLM